MSIVRIATITAQCDNCGAKESSSTIKAKDFRAHLRRAGWRVGITTLCPACRREAMQRHAHGATLETLGLPQSVYYALRRAGYDTIAQVKAAEDCELLCVPRITPDIVTGIKARLEETTP